MMKKIVIHKRVNSAEKKKSEELSSEMHAINWHSDQQQTRVMCHRFVSIVTDMSCVYSKVSVDEAILPFILKIAQ